MKVISLFFIVFFSVSVVAQTNQGALFRIWDKEGEEGYIDARGRVVIKPQFDEVTEFSEGLAAVRIGDKWGYIDRTGKVVIQPRWRKVNPFTEGLASVVEADWPSVCGYINKKGQYIIQPLKGRRSCGVFRDGLALVKDFNDPEAPDEGRYGYLDRAGRWAVKPTFFRAADFKDGLALVGSGPDPRDDYLIDKTGRRVTNVKDCRWRYIFSEGLAPVWSALRVEGFINEKCESVFKLPPEIAVSGEGFSEGLAAAYQVDEKLYGYIDRTGKVVIPFQFAQASSFSDGLAGVVVKQKDKDYKAYINHKGEIVFKGTNSIAGDPKPFKNGLAYRLLKVRTISERPNRRNIYGYMNKQGKYVWLSPGTETFFKKEWIQENYVGAEPRPIE